MTNFAVIFDMDGVIVDNMKHHKRAFFVFAERHGIEMSDEIFNSFAGRNNDHIMRQLFGEITQKEIDDLAHEKESIYREIYDKDIKPVKGLASFLEMLKTKKISRAVATAGPHENLNFTVDKLNIRKYFSVLMDDTHVTKHKPDPEVYLKTAEKLGVEPENCIIVEDTNTGIKAAKNSGAKVIGITTTFPENQLIETDLMINDFTELTIEKINSLLE